MTQPSLVAVEHLSKHYGGVRALRDVSIEIERGEVHALCGENGAGKSTLIKCLAGVEMPDAGRILVDGRPMEQGDVPESENEGIVVIHQESTAFGDLNAVDNIFVGREPRRFGALLLDRPRMRREAAAVLSRLGHECDLRRPLRELSVASRQMISIARALSQQCRLLILDEPTASLSSRETDTLLALVQRLRDDGMAVLLVSHRLDEVFQVAQRVTVLRDGRHVATRATSELDRNTLIQLMVGREVAALADRPARSRVAGPVRLEVKRLNRAGVLHDVSLEVRGGEIVGIGGLVGAGRSELARAVFGIDPIDDGQVLVDGRPIERDLARGGVQAAMAHGVGLVPEDRQHEGLVPRMSVAENMTLVIMRRLARHGLVDRTRQRQVTESLATQLQLKAAGPDSAAETLSGGNQQKLVLGKWLAADPGVLILDEPTRGIDVGAKQQVHQIIRSLASEGRAVLMISSELPELISMCDRILVMRSGRIIGSLDGPTATQEVILRIALPDSAISASSTPKAGFA